jgi:hypothetical protein
VVGASSLVLVLLVGGCADNDRPASSRSEPAGTTARNGATEEVDGVPLAEPAPGFAQQCQEAAGLLGFPVPCPTTLPLVAGEPVDCSGSCVGTAGADETEARIFALDVGGYDDSADAPHTVRHLTIEARNAEDAPPSPCYEGARAGTLEANGHEVVLLECPPSSLEAQTNVRHGEGTHAEHLLGYWDSHGVRYVVSVHRTADRSSALLERLVSSIELVGP